MCGTAAADSSVLTVTRTSSDPASASSRTCRAVASTSAVSVLVIDCTTTGAPPPTVTAPMRTATVGALGMRATIPCDSARFPLESARSQEVLPESPRTRGAEGATARKRSGTRTAVNRRTLESGPDGPPKGRGGRRISQVAGQRGGPAREPPTCGRRTALYDMHLAAGARMVDFGGWDMPVDYGSQIEEHHAVRRDAGMFDVSHMCTLDLRGARCPSAAPAAARERRRPARGPGQGALQLHAAPGRRRDRRPDRLLPRREVVPAGRQRGNGATRTSRGSRNTRSRSASPSCRARDLAMIAVQGPNARAKATPLLPESARSAATALGTFFGASCDDWFVVAHRLHRRRRLRDRAARGARGRFLGRTARRPASRPAGSARATRCGSRRA